MERHTMLLQKRRGLRVQRCLAIPHTGQCSESLNRKGGPHRNTIWKQPVRSWKQPGRKPGKKAEKMGACPWERPLYGWDMV